MIVSVYGGPYFYHSPKGSSMQQTFIGTFSVQGNRKLDESCSQIEGGKSQRNN